MIVSIACAVLWTMAFNLVFVGLMLGYKKIFGSASLFVAGIACLVLLFGVGVRWHTDIAQTFRYVPIGFPLALGYLAKRLRNTDPRPAAWPAPPQDKVDRITKGIPVPPARPKP